jgi:DNA-binding GntR family transcriptional regulator
MQWPLVSKYYTDLLLLSEPEPPNMHPEALPLYLQIADELRRNIEEAVFKVGDRLPTETELSERFGVNRHTLRRAMEVLRQEGIVGVERGRGTFVMATPIAVPIGKRVRFNEALKAQSLKPELAGAADCRTPGRRQIVETVRA